MKGEAASPAIGKTRKKTAKITEGLLYWGPAMSKKDTRGKRRKSTRKEDKCEHTGFEVLTDDSVAVVLIVH